MYPHDIAHSVDGGGGGGLGGGLQAHAAGFAGSLGQITPAAPGENKEKGLRSGEKKEKRLRSLPILPKSSQFL